MGSGRKRVNELLASGRTTKLALDRDSDLNATDAPYVQPSYEEGNFYLIDIDSIQPNPDQPRQFFDQEKLDELAESIRQKGVLQPVLIRPLDGRNVMLVAGERRWRAAKAAGMKRMPCIVTTGNPDEIGLIENVQRDDLKPVEEAEAYEKMIQKYHYTHEQLAQIVGKARTVVTETLGLNRLPESIKNECRYSDQYSRTLLFTIARQKSERRMLSLFNRAKRDSLTTAEASKLAKKTTAPRHDASAAISAAERFIQIISKIDMTCIAEEDRSKLKQMLNQVREIVDAKLW